MKRGRSRGGAEPSQKLSLLQISLKGRGPLLFSMSVVAGVLVFGTLWVWEAVRPRVLDTPEYRIDPHDIVLTPSPTWTTPQDLKQEVIRDASLEPTLSLLDDKLTERIALAFAGHPWVAQVQRVEKFHPARVVVTVSYRVPVAAVVFGTELLPIDRTATLLPRENFSQADLNRLPRVGGITSRPTTRPGNAWRDSRVEGAALIAEALLDSWKGLELVEINALPPPSGTLESVPTFELLTHGGRRIAWGRQPVKDDPSEPTAAEKLQRLKTYVEQHGTLDSVTFKLGDDTTVPHTANAQEKSLGSR